MKHESCALFSYLRHFLLFMSAAWWLYHLSPPKKGKDKGVNTDTCVKASAGCCLATNSCQSQMS